MKAQQKLAAVFAVVLATALTAGNSPAAEQSPNAKLCLTCHKPQAKSLRGHWESVAMKASSVQLKIDDRSEVLRFDKATLKVLNVVPSDLEKQLGSIKKGHEVRIEYTENAGVKYATLVVSKPPIKLTDEEKISLAEVEKLVALGPEKGGFTLIDSRPGPKFKEGTIPGAVSLPFPAFDKNAALLPADKKSLVVFFCSGVTCNMSPSSQKKAKALGYTNLKVFVEGMPVWLGKNYGVLSAKSFAEAYKDIPVVLLDVRPLAQASKGFIKGAVAFPAVDAASLKLLPKKELKAPVIVYDEDGSGNAGKVAGDLIKAGYGNVMVVTAGFAGWKKAQLPVETGALASAATYVPKPKQGEFPMEEFVKMLKGIPSDVVVLDVREKEELKDGVIKGSLNIPAESIEQSYVELPKDKRIITVCPTGTRAEMTYHTLKGKGLTNVSFLNAKVFYEDGQVEISK